MEILLLVLKSPLTNENKLLTLLVTKKIVFQDISNTNTYTQKKKKKFFSLIHNLEFSSHRCILASGQPNRRRLT